MFQVQMMNHDKAVFVFKIIIEISIGKVTNILALYPSLRLPGAYGHLNYNTVQRLYLLF